MKKKLAIYFFKDYIYNEKSIFIRATKHVLFKFFNLKFYQLLNEFDKTKYLFEI